MDNCCAGHGVSRGLNRLASIIGSAAVDSCDCSLGVLPDNEEFLVISGCGVKGEGAE